jgi:hypothetical protein
MGYTAPDRTYQLSLGEEFAGLEVTVRDVSIDEYMRVAGFTDEDHGVGYAIGRFKANLVAWNLEEDDVAHTPIPVSEAGAQDKELVLALTTAWVESLHGVRAPLDSGSPSGQPSLEASIPMDAP